ncbi:uncharacterized protein [Chironomus tepperi]|uniref:uncharacterized protein n=1 Tax=Chironomus tepperi TaxID=113505 RepID=UPI00391F281F
MFNWKLLILVFLSILNANCRVQKALKPANFDADVPKFTPFEDDDIFGNKARHLKTTEGSTSPSPSAETLTKKISSRIKMPEKYVAELSKVKDVRHISNDFGSFDFKNTNEEPQKEEAQQNLIADEKDSHDDDEEEKIDEEIEVTENQNSTLFKVGQLLNVTVDSDDDTVNVNLDHRALQEIFTGRGDKKSGIGKFLPLFILPFLIQSAVLPFMVAKIKLLLVKSLFAGKLAIMLFLLGALKTSSGNGHSKSYGQTAPFLINRDFPTPFLPDKRVQNNVREENEYQKKAEPFVRSLQSK